MKPEIAVIDEAIDKYVHERMEKGKEKASERFLAYAYLKNSADDALVFMKKVSGLTRYYIDFLRIMENPLKGPEVAWFASMVAVAIYACVLLASEEQRMLGIWLLAGTLTSGWFLISAVARKWCDVGVMIAIYRELVEIADNEVAHEI